MVLVERATFPRNVPCAGWLNARCVPLLAELGVAAKRLLGRPFSDVTFYPADFAQSAKPVFETPPGYLIDRARFDSALVKTAVRCGVTFIQGCGAANLQLRETGGLVHLDDGRQLEAKLFLLASGGGSELVERFGLASGPTEPPVWTTQVEVRVERGAASSVPRVAVVLGLDKRDSFAFGCLSSDRVSLSISWFGDRAETVPTLIRVARGAFENGAMPVDLSAQARTARVLRSPSAVALAMDSHVGKHTLVIGDAGGFVSAASNEGIYPAMWSAKIAVDVVEQALGSQCSQDELISFDSVWRMQMADYLRSPHTDIQFLLPLIFTNQPMADRMGAAFFCGENI